MKFSEKLVYLRKDSKFSQEQLADMLDVSRQSVSKWESGQTYPEMDKLLALCKIFKCDLESLTNDEVKSIGNSEKSKMNVVNIIEEFLGIISKSISMFKTMSMKNIRKMILEFIGVILFLLLLQIPFNFIERIPYRLFGSTGFIDNNFGLFTLGLWTLIIQLGSTIFSIVIILYLYKTRYLDKFDEKSIALDQNPKEENISNKEEEKEKRIYVKNEKTSKSSPILAILGYVFILFAKFVLFCCGIPFFITLVALAFALAISILLMFQGVIYIGIILSIIFAIVITSIICEISINLLFSRKNNVKRIIIIFLIGLLGFGMASGVATFEIANSNYINELPNEYKPDILIKEINMTQKTFIGSNYVIAEDNYKIDNNLKDKIRIEIEYYNKYSFLSINELGNEVQIVNSYDNNFIDNKLYKQLIKDLKNKNIYNYGLLYKTKATIYTSEENIQLLKKNSREFYENEEIKNLNLIIDEITQESQKYQSDYYELEDKYNIDKSTYDEKINEYKNQIDQYKQTLKELTESLNN